MILLDLSKNNESVKMYPTHPSYTLQNLNPLKWILFARKNLSIPWDNKIKKNILYATLKSLRKYKKRTYVRTKILNILNKYINKKLYCAKSSGTYNLV